MKGSFERVIFSQQDRFLTRERRRLTIILGRPESIRWEDIDTPFPEFCDDLDPPHTGENIRNLQQGIQLTKIYNRAVR